MQSTPVLRGGMKGLVKNNPPVILAATIVAGIVLRLIVAMIMGNQVEDLPGLNDQITYHTLAMRVLDHQGFTFGENWWPATRANEPTAHWSFLYTFYLVFVYGVFGPNPLVARLIQVIIVGVLHPLLVYKIGTRLFSPTIGLISAALISFYTYLIYYTPALLTEPFYITAVLGTLYQAIRIIRSNSIANLGIGTRLGHALILGLWISAAVLLRQLFLLFLPFLFLWIAWNMRRKIQWAFGQLAAATILLVLMILPFTIFNYMRFGTFVLLNTNAGYALYWANHPVYGTHFESIISPEISNYLIMLPDELRFARLNEAELEKELMKRGIQFIVDDPGRYILLSLSRIPSYFTFWPTPNSSILSNLSRMASFGVAWPFMLYGIVLALVRRNRKDFIASPIFLILLFFLVYSAIHILTWTLIRYRMPVDAVLLIFAAYAVNDLFFRLKKRFWLKPEIKATGP